MALHARTLHVLIIKTNLEMIVILLLFFKHNVTLFVLNTNGTFIKRPMRFLSIVNIIDVLKFWFLTCIYHTYIQLRVDVLERISTNCNCNHLLLKGSLSSEHDIFNKTNANKSENFGFSLPIDWIRLKYDVIENFLVFTRYQCEKERM